MPEAQEAAIKDDNIMVDLDTTGKSVDVELDDSKANTKEVETKDQPIVEVKEEKGSYVYTFKHKQTQGMTVEKGSVCVNGASLTVVNSKDYSFSVAIIPYTYENTNLHAIKFGAVVNLEFDILGKYISKMFIKDL